MNPWLIHNQRRLRKARALLQPALINAGPVWADLGCGDGIFTYLLFENLGPNSQLYALDKNSGALRNLNKTMAKLAPAANLKTMQADFSQNLDLPPLDGLLLANSLHFIQNKRPVLTKVLAHLKPGGRLVVIEYNTSRGNSAVPYPLDEHQFLALTQTLGLAEAGIVSRMPSSFLGEMYTGVGVKLMHKNQGPVIE